MKRSLTQVWESYFEEIGLDTELSAKYIPYIARCADAKIPPIFEQDHLAQLLGLELPMMLSMVFGTKSFYRSFSIPKRSGGRREIVAPYPSLLEAQRWIAENILDSVKVSVCATGFRRGKSILDNARLHCERDQILKIDIKDFFPSISFQRIMRVFTSIGYPNEVAYLLSKICTLGDSLPQGAATSPTLSNIVCRRMDVRFYKVCKRHRLRYTRYADDIAVSGKSIPSGIARLFFEIIEDEGFEVNQQKVRFLGKADRKIITGLDITSGVPRVPRKFRRELKKDVYFVWSAGLSTHVSRRKIFNPQYIDHLMGRIEFWRQVEPECVQLATVQRRVNEIVSQQKSYSGTSKFQL
ncbi:reverse transcriptase family protein [Ruegeria lacuscaerulensis]|uniref:reverse transcriptase family protein n=1 Tax=Ruegeria lacuscaerulensis TaxID=55218 RepID=UPI00147F7780|nr:reverse transcriptase family protein [Ruegeria lacuscaerulensis]